MERNFFKTILNWIIDKLFGLFITLIITIIGIYVNNMDQIKSNDILKIAVPIIFILLLAISVLITLLYNATRYTADFKWKYIYKYDKHHLIFQSDGKVKYSEVLLVKPYCDGIKQVSGENIWDDAKLESVSLTAKDSNLEIKYKNNEEEITQELDDKSTAINIPPGVEIVKYIVKYKENLNKNGSRKVVVYNSVDNSKKTMESFYVVVVRPIKYLEIKITIETNNGSIYKIHNVHAIGNINAEDNFEVYRKDCIKMKIDAKQNHEYVLRLKNPKLFCVYALEWNY